MYNITLSGCMHNMTVVEFLSENHVRITIDYEDGTPNSVLNIMANDEIIEYDGIILEKAIKGKSYPTSIEYDLLVILLDESLVGSCTYGSVVTSLTYY